MNIERLTLKRARVDDCYGVIKRAYLNPTIHLVLEMFMECANRVSTASTWLMHSKKSINRVINIISSENGGMNNVVIAIPALPGGYRNNNNGNYNNMGNNGYFWSSTVFDDNNAWNRKLNYNNSEVNRNNNNKRNGFAIRLLRYLNFFCQSFNLINFTNIKK
ncbi:MAG: hypothetical protein H8E71_01780 [Candidatus Marinimicrobia bacterium]|nr:hypothetical protein [Candidatus Neomarinimicrobiota bacterium]MBL7110206.1 hypothetical protein [Candidatus Neomarinimicrobiota bacterium]